MGRVFISCGQRTASERDLGAAVGGLVTDLTPFEPYFAEEQTTLHGLTDHILSALDDSVGVIAILHDRGEVHAGHHRLTRTSVWIEQEIAIAAFIHQVLQRPLQIAAFQEKGVAVEGMRSQLLLNPVEFVTSGEVLEHLRRTLPTWQPEIRSRDAEVSVSIDYLEQSIASARHEYLLVVTVTNESDAVLELSHADLEMPSDVVEDGTNAERVLERDTKTHAFFRTVINEPLFPGDPRRLFQIRYHMDHELFWNRADLFDRPVQVTLYGGPGQPTVVRRPFRELQVF